MVNRSRIQKYVNNFRRRMGPFLRPGVGITCTVHPTVRGTILEFEVGNGIANLDNFRPTVPTIGTALAEIPQHAFGGNLEGFVFKGTNVILEPDRIILIKDDSTSQWTDRAAAEDVKIVINPHAERLVT